VLRNRFNAVLASGAILIACLALALSPAARAEEAQPPAAAKTTVPAAPADAAKPGEAAKPTEAAKPAAVSPLPDMVMGKADAPVTIIEYSSLSCPHCATFHKDVFPELKTKYIDTGKVRYILREFPLNESALAGTVIARCLEPSRYFAFIHLLFQKQADWAFKEDALTPLKAYAKQAGLSEDEFNKCIDNEALQKGILAIRDEGQKKGVNATPSFFVNGMLLKGAPTLQGLEEAMKPYLSDK
jgi:protein-disulfide isomerase